jgi:hypothetical protein
MFRLRGTAQNALACDDDDDDADANDTYEDIAAVWNE